MGYIESPTSFTGTLKECKQFLAKQPTIFGRHWLARDYKGQKWYLTH